MFIVKHQQSGVACLCTKEHTSICHRSPSPKINFTHIQVNSAASNFTHIQVNSAASNFTHIQVNSAASNNSGNT